MAFVHNQLPPVVGSDIWFGCQHEKVNVSAWGMGLYCQTCHRQRPLPQTWTMMQAELIACSSGSEWAKSWSMVCSETVKDR